MTCEQCEKAVQPQQTKSPSDLSIAIFAASEAVRLGILRYEGVGACGEPFIPYCLWSRLWGYRKQLFLLSGLWAMVQSPCRDVSRQR